MAIHASRYSGRKGAKGNSGRGRSRGKRKFGGKLAGLVVIALLLGVAYVVWGILQPLPKLPQQKDYPVSTNYKDRLNILLSRIDGDEVKYLAVVSIAASERTKIVTLDPNIVVQIPQGRGEYRLGMAMKLGNTEGRSGINLLGMAMKLGNTEGRSGINLLRDAISRVVAVPIDGYVVADSNGWQKAEGIYGDSYDSLWESVGSLAGKASIAWQGLPEGVYTSFSKLDFAKLVTNDYGVEEVVDGAKYETTQSVVGAGFDVGAFDNKVGSELTEKSVVRDHPRVSVQNASGISGVGTAVARYVHNMGGQVINVSTAGKTVARTQIIDHLGGSTLSTRLQAVTRAGVVSDRKLSQADVEVTIGEDARSWF